MALQFPKYPSENDIILIPPMCFSKKLTPTLHCFTQFKNTDMQVFVYYSQPCSFLQILAPSYKFIPFRMKVGAAWRARTGLVSINPTFR